MHKKSDSSKQVEAIWEALKQVIDPELGIDIVSLGLVYKVELTDSDAEQTVITTITMTLTTPGCPLADSIDMLVRHVVGSVPGLDPELVHINLTFDPPWVKDMMTDEAKAELGFI